MDEFYMILIGHPMPFFFSPIAIGNQDIYETRWPWSATRNKDTPNSARL